MKALPTPLLTLGSLSSRSLKSKPIVNPGPGDHLIPVLRYPLPIPKPELLSLNAKSYSATREKLEPSVFSNPI